MQNLLNDLTLLLGQDDRLVAEGKLLKNKIVELALAVDPSLIKLLLKHDAIKKHFFVEVEGVLVFDKIKFQRFVSNKQFLPDSYTAFKNKIGLTANCEYLSESKEVVLAWPYKDCVLEGGQDKEDAKRNEMFWNETLAPDQIDRLLSPKALTGFKRYDKDGEHPVAELSLNDNLIVKGNNLLSLHTLKKVYAAQVKLIYIDPPFNTENDSFQYNDSFNHSTWLTFMHNRLEAAKEFLAKDGAIFVHLDHEEAPYCKVLMDEIFGRENWLNTFSVTTNDASGFKATGKSVFSTANQLFLYAKNKSLLRMEKQFIENEYDTNYNQVLIDRSAPCDQWRYEPITKVVAANLGYDSPRAAKKELGAIFDERIAEFAFDNSSRVFRTAAIQGGARQKRLETIEKSAHDKGKVYLHPNDDIPNFYILNGEGIIFYESRMIEIDGHKVAGQLLTDVWTDIKVTGIADEGGVKLKNGKKPEKLLKRAIDMITTRDDLVMDFFGGSGTTAAVAHKMGRRYICVEQMEYIDLITVGRLKKVVAGDQSGISKAVNWQGGGSFVYCELNQANQLFINQIKAAKSSEDLQAIWLAMQEHAFLSYKLDPKTFDSNISEFASLAFAEQQRFLIEMLDKNLLYVPYSEIDDASYAVSDTDKALNRQFFNLRGIFYE